jgi:hypothetical protein
VAVKTEIDNIVLVKRRPRAVVAKANKEEKKEEEEGEVELAK